MASDRTPDVRNSSATGAAVGASTGSWRHRRQYGVNTLNGSPAAVRRLPEGDACRADRRRRSSLAARRASSTSASRRRPAGPASAARYRRVTPWRSTRSTRAVNRIVVADDQPAAELVVEVGEAAGQEPPAVRTSAAPEAVVDDEQRNDLVTLVERPPQRGVVGEAKIASEPDDSDDRRWHRHQSPRRRMSCSTSSRPATEAGLAGRRGRSPTSV